MTHLQEIEFEAIQYAQVPSVPAEVKDGGAIWIFAIAKVLTVRGVESYVIVRNNMTDSPSVLKAFDTYGIAKFLSIHPYKFLDEKYIQTFKTLAEARKYISSAYKISPEAANKISKEDALRIIISHSIDEQLRVEKTIGAAKKTITKTDGNDDSRTDAQSED